MENIMQMLLSYHTVYPAVYNYDNSQDWHFGIGLVAGNSVCCLFLLFLLSWITVCVLNLLFLFLSFSVNFSVQKKDICDTVKA